MNNYDPVAVQEKQIEYIKDKLCFIYFNSCLKSEGMDTFLSSFDTPEIQNKLKLLLTTGKEPVVIAMDSKNKAVLVYKDTKYTSKKAVLILRASKESIILGDADKHLVFIEMTRSILNQMYIICNDIFYPMLSHTVYSGESELISKDLIEKFHNFLAHFYVCLGQINGKTLLPKPSEEIFRNDKINDNERTQICEGAVVMWIELIKHNLKQEPESAFRDGKNPTPKSEIEFWNNKAKTLDLILKQIETNEVVEILNFLEKQKSTYSKFFKEIKVDIIKKSKEAEFNSKFLSFLKNDFNDFEDNNLPFSDLVTLFVPIFHAIRLIWRDNEYYSKPERLIVLIRKLCNSVINQVKAKLGETIFAKILEPEVTANSGKLPIVLDLEEAREVINKFIKAYFSKKNSELEGWKITRNVIFYRIDAFNDRLGDILNIASSYYEFAKIRTRFLGGVKGQILMNQLEDIYNECVKNLNELNNNKSLDPLDISDDKFRIEYSKFKESIKELERRVSAILTQTFDDSDTIVSKFKVLENFGTMLNRPSITTELEKKYNLLLDIYKTDLRLVQGLFLTGKELIESNDPKNPLNPKMPPIAALLYWTDSLKERIKEPFKKFIDVGKKVTEKEEFREIENLYNSIYNMILNYETEKKQVWDEAAKSNSGEKQKDFILLKKGEFIYINFDRELMQLLKEIKYLKVLNLDIPNEAEEAYKKNNEFRNSINSLEAMTAKYNNIVSSLNEVEKPLVEESLEKIDIKLKDGLEKITWENSDQITAFIEKAEKSITELNTIVDKLKTFSLKVENILKDWKEKKLFLRPKEERDAILVNSEFLANFDKERGFMSNKTKDITNLQDVLQALRSAVKNHNKFKDTPKWKNYQHYINSIIIKGIIDLIYENMESLESCLNPAIYPEPFCIVVLELDKYSKSINFRPPLSSNKPEELSIKSIIIGWVNSYINLATLIRNRVDTSSGDYILEVLENFSIQEMIYRLYNGVNKLIDESKNELNNFNEFKILWEKDFDQIFEEFLSSNKQVKELGEEEKERENKIEKVFKQGNPILKNVTKETPNKDCFDDKINELKNLLKKVNSFEKFKIIRWVKLDYTKFQNELFNIIQDLIQSYKDFLKKNSTNKLTNIVNFMNKVKKGISNVPKETKTEKDSKDFRELLENVRDIKILYPMIVEIVPSIKDELEILKKHSKAEESENALLVEDENETISEEQKLINDTINMEKEIVELYKETDHVYQNVHSLVETECANFKKKVSAFQKEVEAFREEFKQKMPNKIEEFSEEEINKSYVILDQYYVKTNALLEIKNQNNEMEILLNLQLSQNKLIDDCLYDLKLYKTMWDYVSLVYYSCNNLKQYKFAGFVLAPVQSKLEDIKNAVKAAPNELKKNLKSMLDNINKRLSDMDDTITVTDTLKAMKKRHWDQINEIVKSNVPYDQNDFGISHIFNLKMYENKEAIENLKSIASGQDQIEKRYTKINKDWSNAKFEMTKNLNNKQYDFELFDHTLMEAVIENLEKDQVEILQHVNKKAMLENFAGMDEKLKELLEKLQMINKVTKTWLKLQKNWEKLETIFRSPDIKKTLRQQAQDFESFDIKFKEEMKMAFTYKSMDLLCKPDRLNNLETWSVTVAQCDHALNNYLGEKKVKFPRFYFLSNDTLIGMLSYGGYPNIINKNIKDCFDGIKFWIMEKEDDKKCSRVVLGMLSSDNDEEVIFDDPFICEGNLVEEYLGKFEKKMRDTLRDIVYIARCTVKWSEHFIKPPTSIDINAMHEKFKLTIKKRELEKGIYNENIKKEDRRYYIDDFPAQISLLVTMNIWTEETEHAFEEIEGGNEDAMKKYLNICSNRITDLIKRVQGKISSHDLRIKIITVITVDVHGRDIVAGFIQKRINDLNNFNWKKQLRFYYDFNNKDYDIKIADYNVKYSFEYIGNTGRLVTTPLTDRCYITLTQALNLNLGAAPAGPAGTGKTETTKDLSRNLGLGIIVTNCSDQMDIDTTARIFNGMGQTGFWGCFDEFNRISIEVLSVVSTQIKIILDALRKTNGPTTFPVDGKEVTLVRTVGFFITMNPGYAGRNELPENLKALFRYCAMVVPELLQICENMLMSEGFVKAEEIANKFITLYSLSEDLLSQQKHYDWRLRAIKSLLRQAGTLKRSSAAEDNSSGKDDKDKELIIINKALWDFNKAKIVTDDLSIFKRLLDDIFKGIQLNEENLNPTFDQQLYAATEFATRPDDKYYHKISYQKEPNFTLKARQLDEILQVRHCMFILGDPGSGKTAVWKTLFHRAKDIDKKIECAYDKLSPKAVSTDELLGNFDKNKVWRYGILSSIMKKMCKNESPYNPNMKMKWIILDGDIDPDWIESLNTVMDDNRVLTLNNGDRFSLDSNTRLLFEISNLRNATRATVSRGGVLFINDVDIGTKPFWEKWIYNNYKPLDAGEDNENELTNLVYESVRVVLTKMNREVIEKFKNDRKDRGGEIFIAPQVEMNLIQNICCIFQNLIKENFNLLSKNSDEDRKRSIEGIFLFSFMWGVGGALLNRRDIEGLVRSNAVNKLRFPDQGSIFDYYWNTTTCSWEHWSSKITDTVINDFDLFENIIIPNIEVMRLNRIMEINCLEEKPILFIADAGYGKTATIKYFLKNINKLSKTNNYTYKYYIANFNSYTDGGSMQGIIESQIGQRVGNKIGPPSGTKFVYFLDDLNMPALDKYGTQSHVELLRQMFDYKEFYDRKDLDQKKILEDLLYVASQNPKAGSFNIDLRLQRHFSVLCPSKPEKDVICGIYEKILYNHFKDFRFKGYERDQEKGVSDLIDRLMIVSNDLLRLVLEPSNKEFIANAQKFHYQWNLREIARVLSGVLRSSNSYYKDQISIFKLWYHECNRVFRDRMKFNEDMIKFDQLASGIFTNQLATKADGPDDSLKPEKLVEMIFIPFDENIEEDANILFESSNMNSLANYLTVKLEEYNEKKTEMKLVLFEDAIKHICRICRIISNPCSHALLVGVGGSGRQSLSRIAAYLKNIDFEMPNLALGDYNTDSLIKDLKKIILKAGVSGSKEVAFLMNDNHILDEKFLIYINNFLASAWIDEIWESKDELNKSLEKLKTSARSEGIVTSNDPTNEELQDYLIYRIKKNAHIILCMSYVGDTLRKRVRKFPALLTCTSIDWFHSWPESALESVARRKIEELEKFDEPIIATISKSTSEIHSSLRVYNELFYKQERRYNYTTPKSYLELLDFFIKIALSKDDEVQKQIVRLSKGVEIVADASQTIEKLKQTVEVKSKIVAEASEEAKKILDELDVEMVKVNAKKAEVFKAQSEAEEASSVAQKENEIAVSALNEALPAKELAEKNANNIDEKELNTFISLSAPSDNIKEVFKLIYIILFPNNKPTDDLQKIKSTALNSSAKKIKEQLVAKLQDVSFINDAFLDKVKKWTVGDWAKDDYLKSLSKAVYNLMGYFKNLLIFKEKNDIVDPLKKQAADSEAKSNEAKENLNKYNEELKKVVELSETVKSKLDDSNATLAAKTAEKKLLEDNLARAELFIDLLSDNNTRWIEEIARMKVFRDRLVGDCLIAASFVSYIGVFNIQFREKLIEKWKNIVLANDVKISEDLKIINILITPGQILTFKSEGLPADPFSTENSAIITACTRWPLIIDPQMQAINWLKGKSDKKKFVQYKSYGWDKAMGEAIEAGDMLVIEDIDDDLDPLVIPLLAKETTRKNNQNLIKIGNQDYPLHPNSKVFFMTKANNPHYKPEVVAQATLINFIVTERGLEDQLLAKVVNIEKPDLEESIKSCFNKLNEYARELIEKEDDVLKKLEDADRETILDNIDLIESLKETKITSKEINENSLETEDKIKKIEAEREHYRPVGQEGAMLFFVIQKLFVVQYMYRFSLDSFTYFFIKSINETPKYDNQNVRVEELRKSIRLNIYLWVTAGMFEEDKQLFLSMIALRLLSKGSLNHPDCQGITKKHIDFLLKCPEDSTGPDKNANFSFIDEKTWKSLNALSRLEPFTEFATKMMNEQYTKFREWFNEVNPEEIPLPLQWKTLKKHSFFKILLLRCCRPDRCGIAINEFIRECFPNGQKFLESRTFSDVLKQAYNDSSSDIPIFFILSPGSNPIKELENLGRSLKKGKTGGYELDKNFIALAMGQKMDEVAENFLMVKRQEDSWLFLQNIHLMPNWLKKLQDKLKELSKVKGNEDFRLFLSAEPRNNIPSGLLEKCIKLTNEPPTGLKENMKIALNTIVSENKGSANRLEDDRKRIAILFGLCYYHSVVLERKRYGTLGWNRIYPFNLDDLRSSDMVVFKYVTENTTSSKVPWDDLRYIIGEIMYGGHIVDEWDRRLNNSYLDYLLVDKINEDLEMVPYPSGSASKLSLKTPINNSNIPFDKWIEYIDTSITTESPAMFGLHPNAELDYRKTQADKLFNNLAELEPKDSKDEDDVEDGGTSAEDNFLLDVEKVRDALAETVNLEACLSSVGDEKSPFQNVFLQEIEMMKTLSELLKKNTSDIKDACDGKLTMSEEIEALIGYIKLYKVPPKWIKEGFATERRLPSWIESYKLRNSQYKLMEEGIIPKIVYINRLFNPLSYLTAIRQVSAFTNETELDKIYISTEPTNIDLEKDPNQSVTVPKDCFYIFGLHLQGARWDKVNNCIEECKPREDYCVMPVINCKVENIDGKDKEKNKYICPVYKTIDRTMTYVTVAQLRIRPGQNANKWIIAGVAALLDVEKTDNINLLVK